MEELITRLEDVLNVKTSRSIKGLSPSYFITTLPTGLQPPPGFSTISQADDGSSLCCCWADGERAMTLLRLYDTDGAFSSRCRSLNRMGSNKTQSTTSFRLEKMLKKHQRITVKNLGAMLDSSCLDFTFSASSNQFFSSSDESLLKFIFLNACRGSVLTAEEGRVLKSKAQEAAVLGLNFFGVFDQGGKQDSRCWPWLVLEG